LELKGASVVVRRNVRLTIFLLALYCVFPLQYAGAQAARGTISGEVSDPSGSVAPDVQIKLIETQTNQEYATKTGESGFYAIINLMPGLYSLTAEATGFKRFAQQGIQLATGEKIRVDARLSIGSFTETITVKSDAPLLRSETGSLGQVIDNRKIMDLPLNGRNFISLVALSSGVALPPGTAFPRINGGRPRVNEYLYDGISVLQPEPGTVPFFPIIDDIQEFKVETNSPAAEFGRFNGGVINLSTKSGTNAFHGSLFEFFRNEALNARNLFTPATSAKPVFRRNQFGGTIGGPINKDKTFFFGDYQGTRQLIGRIRTSTVPTLLQRQGIFTEAIGGKVPQIYDPASTQSVAGGGYTRQKFPGNTIPSGQIDKSALSLINRYPLPTSSGTSNNYTRVGNEGDTQDQCDIRLDHHLSNRDQTYVRYSYMRDFATPVTPLPDGSGSITTGTTAPTTTTGQSIAASYIHEFGPRVANELRFGYTRRAVDRTALLLDEPASQAVNIPGIPSNAEFSNELPTFSISNFAQLGPSSNTDSLSRTDVTEIVDHISFRKGRHSIKVGLDFRWERLDITQPPSPTGLFSFTFLGSDLPGTSGTGNALASFLLGQVQNFSIDLQQKSIQPRAHIQEYFIQDDWKATSRFTINAGLRWTLNFPSTEVDNQGTVFNLQTQQLDYLGKNGFPRSSRDLHWHDFAPRLGLAYRLTDKTVIRAAYALVWIEQAGITTPFTNPQFPYIQTVSQKALDNINPAFVLASGPSVAPISLTPDAGLGQGVYTVDRSLSSGYVQQWNLFIQREITPNLALSIGYAGSKVTHVGIPDTNINQLSVAQLSIGSALQQKVANPYYGIIPRSSSLGDPTITTAQLLKPYSRFTTVSYFRNNVGNTNYNSFQACLEKRFSRDLSFLISYTFSKLIDEASSVFDSTLFIGPPTNSPVADSFNRKLERDVSTGDIPHAFVVSSTYDLPIGNGHWLNPGGIIGKMFGGWKLAGVLTYQSGIPLAVTQSNNYNSFAGFTIQRPNIIGNPELSGRQRSTARWFNTDAFSEAPIYAIGTSSRNPVRGPDYRNLDISLIKNTKVAETINLEFRAEAFNVTNTPPLSAPNTVKGNSTFGAITSAGDPRVIQFGMKVMF
jgi:hypothetical protein